MPNFDTGHYFLTMLAPIRTGARPGPNSYSYRQRLIEVLARMPNSETTARSRGTPSASPLSRNTMTHLARFVVIDSPAYNGRDGGDTLVAKILGDGAAGTQEVADSLTTPFLLFAADFDAVDGSDAALRNFTDTLWATMAKELQDIYQNCFGFEGVGGPEEFFRYVKRCQIKTNLPFNDYWRPKEISRMPKDLALPVDDIKHALIALGGTILVWLLCLVLAPWMPHGWLTSVMVFVSRWGLFVIPLLLAGAGFWLWRLYRGFMTRGEQAFPDSAKLPDVLKSLYLQQHFLDFVVTNQGSDPATLHAAFGGFVATHQPLNLHAPTQAPGLIRLPDITVAETAP